MYPHEALCTRVAKPSHLFNVQHEGVQDLWEIKVFRAGFGKRLKIDLLSNRTPNSLVPNQLDQKNKGSDNNVNFRPLYWMVYSITTFFPCLFRSTGGKHYRRLHLHSRKNMFGWLVALAHRIHIYKCLLPSFLHNLPYLNLHLCLFSVKKKLFLTTLIIFGNFVMSNLSGKYFRVNGFDFSTGWGNIKKANRFNFMSFENH